MTEPTQPKKTKKPTGGLTPTRKPQGFAAMSPERRAAISMKGGQAAQDAGTAHKWTAESARAAGKKGQAKRAARLLAAINTKENATSG